MAEVGTAIKRGSTEPHNEGAKRLKHTEVTVDNSKVIADVASFKRRTVGSVEYFPQKLLALHHEMDLNCVLQVRINCFFLQKQGELTQRRALWGTDVYTDDSDLLAVLEHLGYDFQKSKHDLSVKLLLLPQLKQYKGSFRHGIASRNWTTRHDGISYLVLEKPREMPRGWATNNKQEQFARFEALKELRNENNI